MYRDNTLIPTEAIRLAALGSLAEGDKQYAELASEIRYFVAHITGPSLDLLGSSLELLHYEGFAMPICGGTVEDGTILQITPAGLEAFRILMTSNVRTPVNEVSKLVIALKMRFLHLLSEEDSRDQADMLSEMCETELARLNELRGGYRKEPLAQWLDLEIAQLQQRLDWFETLQS